jgi:PGF-CTERM protein
MSDIGDLRRRQVLAGFGAGLVAAGLGVGQARGQSNDEVTVTLDNLGAQAWLLDGADEDVGSTDDTNPTLTLTAGTRYRFENLGWSFHPLAFRDETDTPLLTQDGQGTFEDDDEVDWVDEGEQLAFTLTAELADELDDYVCTVHPSMEGTLQTDAADGGSEASFSVSDLSPQSATVEQGTSVQVSATVENTGEAESTQDVILELSGRGQVDSVSLTLAGGESESLSFTVDTSGIEPGEHTHTLSSDDSSRSGSLTVVAPPEPAEFDIVEFEPLEATVTQGDEVTVDVTVENVGDVDEAANVTLELPGIGEVDSDLLALGGGESGSVSLTLDTTDIDPGAYTHVVSTDDDSAEGTLTVEAPPTLEILDVSPDEGTITEGDEFVVNVSVQNVGDTEGVRVVTLELSDLGQADSETLTLAGGESDSVTLAAPGDLFQPGEYTYTVSTPTDESSDSLTVEAANPDDSTGNDDGSGDGDDGGGGDDGSRYGDGGSGDSTDGGGGDDTDSGGGDDTDGGGGDDTDSGDDGSTDTDADGSGPGFGPLVGLTALGGLAAYASRKLGVDDGDDA